MNEDPSSLAVRAGSDPQAFGELYEVYFTRVYNYLRYRCYDPITADDLTSQVFERLLECIHQYFPERGPFEAWLFAVARNVVNSYYRKQRFPWLAWESLHRQAAPGPLVEDSVVKEENRDELLAALARLDDRSRDLLSLKYAAGLKGRQIAAISRLSESNVRVILHRALERLRVDLAAPDVPRLSVYAGEELENERA